MWNCIKCNAVNEDLYTICPKCGASRSAGRFGSATPVKTMAYPQPAEQKPKPAEPKPAPVQQMPPPQEYIPQPDKVRAGGGVRFFGRLLMIVLPLLTLAAAVMMFNIYLPQLNVLLNLSTNLTDPNSSISWISVAAYCLIALGAVLLSILPGLWTLAIGKMMLRFARMEELL